MDNVVATPVPVSGTVTANLSATDNTVLDNIQTSVDALAGTITAGAVDVNATIDTTGLATDATDTSVASIDTKTPALGQALAAASVPVVLTAAQVSTLTPPAAISGFATSAKQDTIIGHVDGVETLLGTIDADTSTLAATDFATEAKQDDIITAIGAIPGGGGVQYTEGDTDSSATGTVAMMEVGSDTLQPIQGTVAGGLLVNLGSNNDVTVTGSVTADLGANNDVTVTGTVDLGATDNAVLDTIAAKDFATQTTLAAMNAKMVTGTDIGDVTINNASGASAVNIQDGGNTITVDGTVGVSGTVAVTQSGTWDEVGINDSGNSITVDYATTGSGTATGALRVELPTNGTGVIATVGAVTAITNALPAGTNAIGKLAANSGVDIGDVDVTSISAGTNLIGDVSLQPRTTNGCTIFKSIDLDESEEEIKATAGNLYGYFAFNAATTTHYIKFYNATAANVTVGTTTPVLTFPIPAGSAANISFAYPVGFATAITAAATTGIADNDTGAPAANAVTLNAFYK